MIHNELARDLQLSVRLRKSLFRMFQGTYHGEDADWRIHYVGFRGVP